MIIKNAMIEKCLLVLTIMTNITVIGDIVICIVVAICILTPTIAPVLNLSYCDDDHF